MKEASSTLVEDDAKAKHEPSQAPPGGELLEQGGIPPILSARFDEDGRLTSMNPAGRRMLGHRLEADLSWSLLSDHYSEADAELIYREALPLALESGAWSGNAVMRTGPRREIATEQHLVAHRTTDGEPSGFTVIAWPATTGSLPDADELRRRNRAESLGLLAMGLVHDVKNLLGPLSTYCDLAFRYAPADGKSRYYLHHLRRAHERLQALVGRLLRADSADRDRKESVRIERIAEEVVSWLRASRPSLELAIRAGADLPPVWGDSLAIHQVLMNLCSNAAEALAETGGSVVVELAVVTLDEEGTLTAGRYVKLSVLDSGPGIASSLLEDVFRPFVSTKPTTQASGLGLAVARQIVGEHDGDISIASELGTGTKVTVLFPAAEGMSHQD